MTIGYAELKVRGQLMIIRAKPQHRRCILTGMLIFVSPSPPSGEAGRGPYIYYIRRGRTVQVHPLDFLLQGTAFIWLLLTFYSHEACGLEAVVITAVIVATIGIFQFRVLNFVVVF
jgi:hypothetical protein